MNITLKKVNQKIGDLQREHTNKFTTLEKMIYENGKTNEKVVENLKSIEDENRKTNENLKSIEKKMDENFMNKIDKAKQINHNDIENK